MAKESNTTLSEKEIFEHLFELAKNSNDQNGVVTSCLMRDGRIIADGISMNDGVHAEYALLTNILKSGQHLLESDLVYTTVEPCGKRTPGSSGEKMGDCTTNLIKAGVKHVVYAAADPDASEQSRHKLAAAGCQLIQVHNPEIIRKAIQLFNATVSDPDDQLPEPNV